MNRSQFFLNTGFGGVLHILGESKNEKNPPKNQKEAKK